MAVTDTLKKRPQRWRLVGGLAALAIIQLVSYQNCGADFVVKDGLNVSASSSACELGLQSEFQSSYYSFLKTSCASCHTGNGPGQGAFAANDPSVAFAGFLAVGSDKVDSNATNSAHAGSYTGAQNSSAIALASQQWAAAEASCKAGGGGSGDSGAITKSKLMSIAPNAVAKDITWNLDTELASGAGMSGGASLIIAVRQIPSANGSPVYYFSNPRLKGESNSVSISGLKVRINDQEQTLGSTWSRTSGSAAAGATVVLSASQMILEYDAASANDTLSISIDSVTSP
jgi:hypothetical protein